MARDRAAPRRHIPVCSASIRPTVGGTPMSRVFITGSSDGLGLLAAQVAGQQGPPVTLHARNDARAADARRALPQAEAVVAGDLSSIDAMRQVAAQVNALGRYDAVIHNVGVGYREPRIETADGLSHVFAVNVLAPYLLTALDRAAAPAGVSQLRDAPRRRPRSGRSAMDGAALERVAGLLRQQIARCGAGLRGGPALAGRAVERAGARLGADENGRPGRAGRPGAWARSPRHGWRSATTRPPS